MNKQLLNALIKDDNKKIAKEMIHPGRNFVGDNIEYEFENDKGWQDAIDYKNLSIKTDVWMEHTLEQDEFSRLINRLIYLLTECEGNMFDYEIVEYFQKELKMDFDEVENGYTYNNPDSCDLDRDIHYTTFKYDGESYVIFSVHYGADARVGFGWNACFKIDEDYFLGSMEISCYDSVTDDDYNVWDLENIATYNEEEESWYHKESGNLINIHSSANGW